MDLFFVTISFVFILFLAISYFMGVIKLSSPLILIYLVFCFSYLINQDFEKDAVTDFKSDIDKDDYISENYVKDNRSKKNVKLEDNQVDIFQKKP